MQNEMTVDSYNKQLETKVAQFSADFAGFFSGEPEVFESPIKGFRSRAEFRVWHDQDDLYHIMFEPETKNKYRVDSFPIANDSINRTMRLLIPKLKANEILRRKLFQIDYLSGLSSQVLVSLLYHKQLDDNWVAAAKQLKDEMSCQLDIHFVGRARKQKVLLDQDFIIEQLPILGKKYAFKHIENSFTQPNAQVNCKMIEWALDASQNLGGTLIELYCGAGNFSLPLAQNFEQVLGTEISRTSVEAANYNIGINGISNVQVLRMSSEEFTQAYQGTAEYKRLQGLNLQALDISTVLVDPPRAGLDAGTVELVSQFQNILYISCNPSTLLANLEQLGKTHQVKRLALFDQFPYTHHVESGVFLQKR